MTTYNANPEKKSTEQKMTPEPFYRVQMTEQEIKLLWNMCQQVSIQGALAPILVSLMAKLQTAAQHPLVLAQNKGGFGAVSGSKKTMQPGSDAADRPTT